MRVERFSLFFPPKLLGVRRGETEYTLGAVPIGGYVKITGMNPEELAQRPPEVARRAYYAQPPWKRVAVILAGPSMNLLVAFALFWAVLISGNIGGVVTIEKLNPSVQTIVTSPTVLGVDRSSAAAHVL